MSKVHRAETRMYRIVVGGALDEDWSDWLGGLTIAPQSNGQTWLTGPVVDQAALHGLLDRIRDVGLPLLSVKSWQEGKGQPSAKEYT